MSESTNAIAFIVQENPEGGKAQSLVSLLAEPQRQSEPAGVAVRLACQGHRQEVHVDGGDQGWKEGGGSGGEERRG